MEFGSVIESFDTNSPFVWFKASLVSELDLCWGVERPLFSVSCGLLGEEAGASLGFLIMFGGWPGGLGAVPEGKGREFAGAFDREDRRESFRLLGVVAPLSRSPSCRCCFRTCAPSGDLLAILFLGSAAIEL